MRVIDRPELRALTWIGEAERLQSIVDKIAAVLRRHLSARQKAAAIERIIQGPQRAGKEG